MNKRSLGALVVLNLVLLVALMLVTLTPQPASAQLGARSEYLMVAGDVTGRTQQAAVYVIDISTGRMVAVFYNGSDKSLTLIGAYDMSRDLKGQ